MPHPARKKRQRGAWQPNVGTESRSQWICSQTRQACACSWEACYPVSYLLQRQKGGLSTRRRICLDSLGETGNCHFVVTPCAGVECTGHSWSQCEVALIANTQQQDSNVRQRDEAQSRTLFLYGRILGGGGVGFDP